MIAELGRRSLWMWEWYGLQWGRDQLIAEFRVPFTTTRRGARLQWGRDQLIAELEREGAGGSRSGGFNGAAIN